MIKQQEGARRERIINEIWEIVICFFCIVQKGIKLKAESTGYQQ